MSRIPMGLKGRVGAAVRAGLCVVAAGLALSAGPGGCATTQRAPLPDVAGDAQRQAEAWALAARAQQYAKDGNRVQAIALYRQALALSSDLPAAWTNLGVLLLEQQDYMGAVSSFNVAAGLSPFDPRPLSNMGVAYLEAGWAKEALNNFEKALDRDPNDLQALRGLLAASRAMALYDDATLERIKKALLLERDPTWRAAFLRQKSLLEGQLGRNPTYAGPATGEEVHAPPAAAAPPPTGTTPAMQPQTTPIQVPTVPVAPQPGAVAPTVEPTVIAPTPLIPPGQTGPSTTPAAPGAGPTPAPVPEPTVPPTTTPPPAPQPPAVVPTTPAPAPPPATGVPPTPPAVPKP
jgi:hypothetical protein